MGHPVDMHVGRRVRYRRWVVGMSQQALAAELGVTFQQIQKYEIGANRISASRLWAIARLLGVPVEFFFEGLLPEPAAATGARRRNGGDMAHPGQARSAADPVDEAVADRLASPVLPKGASLPGEALDRDAATLLRNFVAIPPAKRRRLLDLARALCEPHHGEGRD